MDTSITMTTLFIVWTLFGILLAWMLIFATLALRPDPTKKFEVDEISTYSRSATFASAPSTPHVTVAQTELAPVSSQAR